MGDEADKKPGKPQLPRHGTVRRYKAGCICDRCRAANTEARRRERESAAKAAGKPVPTSRKRVPTQRTVPTAGVPREPTDLAVDDAFTRMARYENSGPIEREVWNLLGEADDAASRLKREVVLRAAQIMDTPKSAALFKSAADVLRAFIADHLDSGSTEDGEGDVLAGIMASFGGARGRGSAGRSAAAVDDSAES